MSMKDLYKNADKSEKELAHDEFMSNLETANLRLDELEKHLAKIRKGEDILEEQFNKAWRTYNEVRDMNLRNMERMQKDYGMQMKEQKDVAGRTIDSDVYQNHIADLQNRMVAINNQILEVKGRMANKG